MNTRKYTTDIPGKHDAVVVNPTMYKLIKKTKYFIKNDIYCSCKC